MLKLTLLAKWIAQFENKSLIRKVTKLFDLYFLIGASIAVVLMLLVSGHYFFAGSRPGSGLMYLIGAITLLVTIIFTAPNVSGRVKSVTQKPGEYDAVIVAEDGKNLLVVIKKPSWLNPKNDYFTVQIPKSQVEKVKSTEKKLIIRERGDYSKSTTLYWPIEL